MENPLKQIKKLDPRYLGDRMIERKYGSENGKKLRPYSTALITELCVLGGSIVLSYPRHTLQSLIGDWEYLTRMGMALVDSAILMSLTIRARTPELLNPIFYEGKKAAIESGQKLPWYFKF